MDELKLPGVQKCHVLRRPTRHIPKCDFCTRPDSQYQALKLGDPKSPHESPAWVAFTLAFSALGKQMTGLPIDFQIQAQSEVNKEENGTKGVRSALIVGAIRRQNRTAFKSEDCHMTPRKRGLVKFDKGWRVA